MKIIKVKLEKSIIKLKEEIKIHESDILWIETANEDMLQEQFETIQSIMNKYFLNNRIILVTAGYKLMFAKTLCSECQKRIENNVY